MFMCINHMVIIMSELFKVYLSRGSCLYFSISHRALKYLTINNNKQVTLKLISSSNLTLKRLTGPFMRLRRLALFPKDRRALTYLVIKALWHITIEYAELIYLELFWISSLGQCFLILSEHGLKKEKNGNSIHFNQSFE